MGADGNSYQFLTSLPEGVRSAVGLFLLFLLAAPVGSAPAGGVRILLATGLGGDLAHANRFDEIGGRIAAEIAKRGLGSAFLQLSESRGATRASIREALAEAARSDGAGDRLFVLLLGHADAAGGEAAGGWRFHLPEEDLTAEDLRADLAAYPGEVLLVLAAPRTGRAGRRIASDRVRVLAADATEKGNLLAAPEALADALEGLPAAPRVADLVTAFEAKVVTWYARNEYLRTERAALFPDSAVGPIPLLGTAAAPWAARAAAPAASAPAAATPGAADPFSAEALRELAADDWAPPGSDAVVLLRAIEQSVDEAGVFTQRRREIFRILTPRGRERVDRAFLIRPPDDTWSIRAFRIHRPDTVIDADSVGIVEMPLAQGEEDLLSRGPARLVRIHFPDLAPGHLAEVEYVLRSKTYAVGAAPGFDEALVDDLPVRRLAVRITSPRTVPLRVAVRRLPEPTVEMTRYGRTHRIEAERLAAVANEPFSPPAEDLAPRLVVAREDKWEKVGRWYDLLSAASRVPDGTVRAAAAAAVSAAGGATAAGGVDPVQAVYDWVATKIRYVHIPLGWHSHKPFLPAGTLRRGYGDCKDKAALLIAALAAEGTKAHFVLISSGGGELLSEAPRAYAFNHAIVAIPEGDGFRFLDPTSEFAPYGTLPLSDEGREALVVLDDGGRIVRTPVSTPEENRISIDRTARIETGSLVVSETRVFHGQSAFLSRVEVRSEPQEIFRAQTAATLAGRLSGATLLDLAYDHADSTSAPFILRLSYRVPLPAGLVPIPIGTLFGALPSPPRKNPIQLPARLLIEETTVLDRTGMEELAVPEGREISNDAGEARTEISEEGHRIVARQRILLPNRDLPAEAYEALREILAPEPLHLGATALRAQGFAVRWIWIGAGLIALAAAAAGGVAFGAARTKRRRDE